MNFTAAKPIHNLTACLFQQSVHFNIVGFIKTGSKFYNGWNAGFTAADFETTEAILVPKEGVAPVPGTEAV